MKICSKCNESKPENTTFFYAHPNGANGLDSFCKGCRKKCSSNKRIEPKYDSNSIRMCTKCHEGKYLTAKNFSKAPTNILGISPICKSCANKREAERRDANRVKEQPITNYVELRFCGHCEQNLPTIAFGFNTLLPSGFNNVCKMCVAIRAAERKNLVNPRSTKEFITKLEKFSYKCAYCKTNPFEHIDHFYPLNPRTGEVAGTSEIINLFPSCASCNTSKKNKNPVEWLKERGYEIIYV